MIAMKGYVLIIVWYDKTCLIAEFVALNQFLLRVGILPFYFKALTLYWFPWNIKNSTFVHEFVLYPTQFYILCSVLNNCRKKIISAPVSGVMMNWKLWDKIIVLLWELMVFVLFQLDILQVQQAFSDFERSLILAFLSCKCTFW